MDLASLEQANDVVVKCPASCFFIGEYAVLNGKPALVLPVPVYLYLGARLTNSENLELNEFYRPAGSDVRHPEDGFRREEQTGAATRRAVFETMKEHMESNMHVALKGLAMTTRSEIPSRCGLGSSGAVAAAMSTAVHILLRPEMAEKIGRWGSVPLEELLLDPTFGSVFQLAWKIERVYHGKSSGSGPFASLIGSRDGLPLVYSVLDEAEYKIYARRLSELIKGQKDLVLSTLWNDAGFALVFSGEERKSTEMTISNTEVIARKIERGLLRLQKELTPGWPPDIPQELGQLADLESAARKVDADLWNTFALLFIGWMTNLLNGDIDDLKRMVNLAQGLLSFLTVSTDSIDKFARVCNADYGVSCKITGSGKGGDVLLFGQKQLVQRCVSSLADGPYRLHYASWLDRNPGHDIQGIGVEWTRSLEGASPPVKVLPARADFALVTAIEEEQEAVNVALESVKSVFGLSRDAIRKNQTDYFYGWLKSKSSPSKEHFVVCARCLTTGNQASQALTDEILADWDPTYLLLVGTAGGVKGRKEIQPCDVVVSTTIAYDMKKEGHDHTDVYPHPVKTPSADLLRTTNQIIDRKDDWWRALGKKPLDTGRDGPAIISDQIISGEDLRGNEKSQELAVLLRAFPKAVAVEMEGGGVGFALWEKGTRSRTEYSVVKGITDYVNYRTEENQKTRDMCRTYAAKAAASLALTIAQNTI